MLLLTCAVSFHRRSIFNINRDDFSMLRIFFNSEYQHQLGVLRRFGSMSLCLLRSTNKLIIRLISHHFFFHELASPVLICCVIIKHRSKQRCCYFLFHSSATEKLIRR